jgi:hypothetical protein
LDAYWYLIAQIMIRTKQLTAINPKFLRPCKVFFSAAAFGLCLSFVDANAIIAFIFSPYTQVS